MRLNRAGEYAVRCVMHLAKNGNGGVISRREVARAMEIPEPFLAKIARQLTLAGILDVTQGSRGGYRLAKDPGELTLLEVVEAMMGEIFLNDCLCRPQSCRRSPTCLSHRVWKKANQQLRSTLKNATIAQISR
jgi:Rrf2 family iron-sulfur cluster assembly transcriptional regulator